MREGLTVAEAQELILEATPTLGAETIAAFEAADRVLAEEIGSTRRHPPADCSAMDGYAVRRADLSGASRSSPVTLPVVFEVPAGAQATRTLAAGEAARIFTGAPLPPGADAVVRQEDTTALAGRGGQVRIEVEPERRAHIRDAGEDFEIGDRLIEAGTRLGAAHLGVLASVGRTIVSVHQRPTVAILSGGDELVEPDRPADAGQIVSSNSYTLAAQCREIGARPVYLGIAADRPEAIEARLRAGLRADVIVSSAGVSVGDHDHVREVLEKVGCKLRFWGVLMKPGFPLAFGVIDATGTLVFGLPGNPVSTAVTFEEFVRPALRKMMGHRALHRPVIQATLSEALRKKPGRLHLVRVALAARDGGWVATPPHNQSSGVLTSMIRGQGLAVFPLEAEVLEAGARVEVQILDTGFFDQAQRGF
ncbi:MAG: molybdopterin molybdotransferase MoeA [Deltaproteobacteria bacterium]|nr:molybdopterin molybdotransferase MoeA [Deltaproteobacteria bacterium]